MPARPKKTTRPDDGQRTVAARPRGKRARAASAAWTRAEAAGRLAARTGAKNPYRPGTYCATSFNHGLQKALSAPLKS